MFQLRKVRDVFGIGPEIPGVIIPILPGVGMPCQLLDLKNVDQEALL